MKLVLQRNRLQNCFNFMIAVRPFTMNAEAPIDLCESRKAELRRNHVRRFFVHKTQAASPEKLWRQARDEYLS